MSRTIVKHSWTNPVTKTKHIRYEKSLGSQMASAVFDPLGLTIAVIAGFFVLIYALTDGHDENYEEACARRDAMPKKSAKVELTILGIAGVIFLIAVLCWLVPIFL